ncbi:MAG: nitrite/sulfite reductase [Gammaproteobacteria bacterium]|nr:nitrite/sulfite reductase [Gammaproteobacteria bacterium]
MYNYSTTDQQLVDNRVHQFRDQTNRFLAGHLSDDQFRPLRLMNGLYVQRYAPMLRVAIPYGELSSTQLNMLADIADTYDRGFGHITTRQNIQFNWPELKQVPDILEKLATVQMHAIQTSGNCVRNITCDHLAGIDSSEIEDPRPWCELLRQWSSLHPEFLYLPRKFKIALTGSPTDRAAILAHDIGLRLIRNKHGETGFEVYVGGGQGRTPVVAKLLRPFLAKSELLVYLEAILRVYNLNGRRDNKYKARIKILVKSMGLKAFKLEVDEVFQSIKSASLSRKTPEISLIKKRFKSVLPDSVGLKGDGPATGRSGSYARWLDHNTLDTRFADYKAIYVSLKHPDRVPGDITAAEMRFVAKLADRYSAGLVRTTHTQNLLFPLVHRSNLIHLWEDLSATNLSAANIKTVQDIICCPGFEYCSLANTTSIPVAHEIQSRFKDRDELQALGDIQIKISGCMNACGHHHIGHIGILGVRKNGQEWFQITLGGRADDKLKIGRRLGRAINRDSITDTVELIIRHYLEKRLSGQEYFLATLDRIGIDSFKEAVYG